MSHADRWTLYCYSRWRRVEEVCAFRERILPLLGLKYGMSDRKPTDAIIAGDVRQLDILRARCVTGDPQRVLLLGEMSAVAFRLAAQCGITKQTHKIVSIKLLVTPPRKPNMPPKGDQMIHWSARTHAYCWRRLMHNGPC